MKQSLRRRLIICGLCFSLFSSISYSQDTDLLRNDFPGLFSIFEHEIRDQKADFIIAVDVSGSMLNHRNIVVPALETYFRSLPEGDYLSMIKFGTEARVHGIPGELNSETLNTLLTYPQEMYIRDNSLFHYTDLYRMAERIADELNRPGGSNLKYVFMFTDFEHDPHPSARGREEWERIRKRVEAENKGNKLMVYALKLRGTNTGRDLHYIRDIFPMLEEIDISNQQLLNAWFERKRAEIGRERLRVIVERKFDVSDTRERFVSFQPMIDVEGNLYQKIHFPETPLVEKIEIVGINTFNPGFNFHPSLPASFIKTGEKEFTGAIRFGRIAFPFFRLYSDSIALRSQIHTIADAEMGRLGLTHLLVDNHNPVPAIRDQWVFTFFLPLYVSIGIFLLIAVYIVLVILAMLRNRKVALRGAFTVRDNAYTEVGKRVIVRAKRLSIGQNAEGKTALNIPQADWRVVYFIKSYSPLLFWKKNRYAVKLEYGSAKHQGKDLLPNKPKMIPPYSGIETRQHKIVWNKS